MKNMYLEDFAYPCVCYAKRRTESPLPIKDILELSCERYTATTILNIGDIVVWQHNRDIKITDVMLTIMDKCVITTKARFDRHFGVYEGDGMVSDLTFDSDNYHPRIRLMPLSEHPTPRDIIRFKAVAVGEE